MCCCVLFLEMFDGCSLHCHLTVIFCWMFAVIPTQQALDAEEMSDTGPGTAHKEEMQLTAGT